MFLVNSTAKRLWEESKGTFASPEAMGFALEVYGQIQAYKSKANGSKSFRGVRFVEVS